MSIDFPLKIPNRGFLTLERMCEHADSLDALVSKALEEAKSKSFAESAKEAAQAIGIEEEVVTDMLEDIAVFQNLMTKTRLTPDEFVNWLFENVEVQAKSDWLKNNKKDLAKVSKIIANILGRPDALDELRVFHKAKELQELHQNILLDSRVITDVRPIFNVKADRITEVVVSHQLFMRYSDGARRRIEFTLDAQDVADLRRQCDRAIIKAASLKKTMSAQWPVTLQGSEEA